MLDIDIVSRNGILFVRLFGKLTKENSSKLNKEVLDFIDTVGIYNIVINIQNIFEIDLYGLKAIKKCYKTCKNSLICANPNQFKMLEDMKVIYEEREAMKIIKI